MKKVLITAAVVVGLSLLIYLFLWMSKKAPTMPGSGSTVDVQPPPTPPPGGSQQILSSEVGEGKLLFDAYIKKFKASPQDVATATANLNPLSIFDGTNDKAWETRFNRFGMQIEKVPTPQTVSLISTLSSTGYFNGLWGTVDAIRAANNQIVHIANSNLLPGNPEVNSNDFVEEILCPYVSGGCSKNDKKRNSAAEKVAKKAADDFSKILLQWNAYNEAAADAIKVYTLARLNDAGYKIL